MGLSQLAKVCQRCPYVDTCDHKQMEALGYLSMPTPKIEPLNTQVAEIKLNNMPLPDLIDKLKPIYNALGYFKGYH